jgi:hypothetical protein
MTETRVRRFIIGAWLASFVFSVAIVVFYRVAIPDSFGGLMREGFDTFGPGLAMMSAFAFEPSAKRKTRKPAQRFVGWFAPALAVLYVGVFDVLMAQFAFGDVNASQTIESFKTFRPFVSPLVTGMLAYYFKP